MHSVITAQPPREAERHGPASLMSVINGKPIQPPSATWEMVRFADPRAQSYRNAHTQRTQKIAQNLTWRAVTTASGAANTHRSAKSGRTETTAAQPALGGMLRDSFRMYHQRTRSGDSYTRRYTGVPSSRAARVRHRARCGSPGPSTQRLKSFSRLPDTAHTFGANPAI